MTYYRAIPARGTHPGAYVELPDCPNPVGDERFEHDPRGYHPDWQRGWQSGYTDGWRHWRLWSHDHDAPHDVDEQQWTDGFTHGFNVGAYDGLHSEIYKRPQPSPWWRDPHAEAPDGYQAWTVLITVPDVPGSTPRDVAARAWEALTCDRPPVVEVYPATGSPADAVTVDLSAPEQDD